MHPFLILTIGYLAQAFFSARILVQWIMSERARKVLSPSIFWILSLAGSLLLGFYGWLKDDFAIVTGQLLAYYIYIWNLNIKGIISRLPRLLTVIIYIIPVIAIILIIKDPATSYNQFFQNSDIPLWLLFFGFAGQILFTLRFVYQYFYSKLRESSLLPAGFWIISICGSILILAYALIRLDPVLILGQSVGLIAYIRNLILLKREKQFTLNI